ncbi:MAG: hypothetical protein OEU32_05375 [Acidimicrobiia bacterium]|nr:hypothetical protein [Acidimicrobiia bacterium]
MFRSVSGGLVVSVALVLVAAACAGGERPDLTDEEIEAPSTTPSTDLDPEPEPVAAPFTGVFAVDDTTYQLEFTCYRVGDDGVLAVGKGGAADGTELTAIVQRFPSDDYIALVFGDPEVGTAWEPAVDGVIEVGFADDVLAATDVDLFDRSGAADTASVGTASVEVRCLAYDEGTVPEPLGG